MRPILRLGLQHARLPAGLGIQLILSYTLQPCPLLRFPCPMASIVMGILRCSHASK